MYLVDLHAPQILHKNVRNVLQGVSDAVSRSDEVADGSSGEKQGMLRQVFMSTCDLKCRLHISSPSESSLWVSDKHSLQGVLYRERITNEVIHHFGCWPFGRRFTVSEHIEEHCAQRIDVCIGGDRFPGSLLRGCVATTPETRERLSDREISKQLTYAEVRQHWAAVGGEQYIGGFDVTVDNILRMGVGKSIRQFTHYAVWLQVAD